MEWDKYLSDSCFRWVRSNEEFTEGYHNFNVKFDTYEGLTELPTHVSFGISWEPNLSCDSNTFYFSNAQVYCNYYPTVTHNYNQLFNTPPKCKLGDTLGVTIDFNNKEVEFFINYDSIFKTPLMSEGSPVYIVGALFIGSLQIV